MWPFFSGTGSFGPLCSCCQCLCLWLVISLIETAHMIMHKNNIYVQKDIYEP